MYIITRIIGENHVEVFPADVVPQNDSGRRQLFLNVVVLASRFQVASKMVSNSPAVVLRGRMQSWIGWAGTPKALVCDIGGEQRRSAWLPPLARGQRLTARIKQPIPSLRLGEDASRIKTPPREFPQASHTRDPQGVPMQSGVSPAMTSLWATGTPPGRPREGCPLRPRLGALRPQAQAPTHDRRAARQTSTAKCSWRSAHPAPPSWTGRISSARTSA